MQQSYIILPVSLPSLELIHVRTFNTENLSSVHTSSLPSHARPAYPHGKDTKGPGDMLSCQQKVEGAVQGK